MSLAKLNKYLNKYSAAVIPAQSQKLRVPVVLSDSKGLYLKSSVSQRVEQNILWWYESSRKTSKGVNRLKENLPRKIRLLGNIHLYVWFATCDLASKTKGGAVILNPIDQTQDILEQYQTIINLVKEYPNSKVTLLETPLYSIACYNQFKGFKSSSKQGEKNKPSFDHDQDKELQSRILNLNSQIKILNRGLGQIAAAFNQDVYESTKRRTQRRQGPPTTSIVTKFSLYRDGIHPKTPPAKVWLRKLELQVFMDCWSR
jgi:hypothetical protein